MMDMQKLFSLEGRVALVTGGSKNLGKWIAQGFIAAGAERVYINSRNADACEATAAELGPNAVPLPMDLSSVTNCRALAAMLAERDPKLDILVNNAGVVWGAPYKEFPEAGWDKVMDLNVKSPFFLTQALYPQLKAAASAARPAKVINIGSIDGMRLSPFETFSYHASKSAILFMTKRIAAQLVSDHIYMTAIAPGAFPSDMNVPARDHAAAVANRVPCGRLGASEDMAATAVYLASRAGDYVIGETIAVDGGVVNAMLGVSLST
jgi:NAD(P)-dependent dehydrogenase (short-subunit alcohol dehydrogenase family)